MTPVPAALAWTRRLESLEALDPVVRTLRPFAATFVADPSGATCCAAPGWVIRCTRC